MRTEQATIYVSDDGKKFPSEEDCIAHEKAIASRERRLSRLQVYIVAHSFDGTEGRGYAAKTYVVTDASLTALVQWCIDKFGPPLTSWYGDGHYDTWSLSKVPKMTAEDALKMDGKSIPSIGSTRTTAKVAFVSQKSLNVENMPDREFPWPRSKKD